MKFITEELKKALLKYPHGSQDQKGWDAIVIAKFFTPYSSWTWYVLEYDAENDDNTFNIMYWLVDWIECEYGSFSLQEMEETMTKFWCHAVERDLYFPIAKLKLSEIPELTWKY